MAWKPEVQVSGKWCRNGLVFATEQEARDSASDLMFRWFAVQDSRAVEVVGEPPNYSYVGRELKRLETAEPTIPTIVGEGAIHPVGEPR